MKLYIKAAQTKYPQYFVQAHGPLRYHVHMTEGLDPNFAAQMSKITPYDDADYYWATIMPDKSVKIILGTRVQEVRRLPQYADEDYESVAEYIDDCLDQVLLWLNEYNRDIKPVMVHN